MAACGDRACLTAAASAPIAPGRARAAAGGIDHQAPGADDDPATSRHGTTNAEVGTQAANGDVGGTMLGSTGAAMARAVRLGRGPTVSRGHLVVADRLHGRATTSDHDQGPGSPGGGASVSVAMNRNGHLHPGHAIDAMPDRRMSVGPGRMSVGQAGRRGSTGSGSWARDGNR